MKNKYVVEEDKEYLEYLEREKKEAHMSIYDDHKNSYFNENKEERRD